MYNQYITNIVLLYNTLYKQTSKLYVAAKKIYPKS